MKKAFWYVAIILLMSSIIQTPALAENDDELTILFTHDLHDNYYPLEVDRDGEKQFVGGVARLYEAIAQERAKDPDALLIDAGDFSMGTLFQTIFSTDAPMLRLMGVMQYDAITYGNHEFDFRAVGLANALKAAQNSGDPLPPIVSSNIIYPTDKEGNMEQDLLYLKEAMADYGVAPYRIVEKKGVKIGIFGLLGKEAASNAPMAGVTFDDNIKVAKKMVKHLKEVEKVDIVIASSHSGTSPNLRKSEDEQLAKQVPGINVIISGHTHTTFTEPIIHGNTIIGSAGEYGENLGVIKFAKSDKDVWQFADYSLVHIDNQFEENVQIAEKIEQFKAVVQKNYLDLFQLKFDQVVAHTPFDFTNFKTLERLHAESTIGNLLGDAYIQTVKELEGENYEEITAAVIPAGVIRNSFYEGDITVSDVFNVSSLGIGPDKVSGYPIVEVYLTGKELKTVAEVDASVAPIMPVAQLYVAGLSYTFNPNRLIFNKVTEAKIQKADGSSQEIEDDKLYRIVAGLYTGQMLPIVSEQSFGLLSVVPKRKDGTAIDNFEDHIIYMDGQRELKEWYALAHYLSSFDKKDGIPQVPSQYADVAGRKNIDDNRHILAMIKDPNGITWTIYGIVLALIALIIFAIRWLLRRKKKK